jgi:hypothetical protein
MMTPFISSGDLRIHLVTEPNDKSPERVHFEKVRRVDNFITEPSPRRLDYDPRFQVNRKKSLFESIENPGNVWALAGRPKKDEYVAFQRTLAGMHANSTVVLCGTGPSYDNQFTAVAKQSGATVISMGSNVWVNPAADYWIGRKSPVEYPTTILRRQTIVKFTHFDHMDHQYFNETQANLVGNRMKDVPATLFYKDADTSIPTTPADLSTFGHDCTLPLALSLCAMLGFYNIVLNGVDLGPTFINPAWTSPEFRIMPREQKHKEEHYPKLLKDFDRIAKYLNSRGIRLYSVGSVNELARVSILDPTYAASAIKKVNERNVPPERPTGPRLSPDERKRYRDLMDSLNKDKVNTSTVLDHLQKLMEAYPEKFDNEGMRKVLQEYEVAKETAGCTGCAKGKIGGPAFDLFKRAIVQNDPKILDVWQEVMPNNYCILIGSNFVFMPGKEDMKEELEEFKKVNEKET